jgi:hypothetical protein
MKGFSRFRKAGQALAPDPAIAIFGLSIYWISHSDWIILALDDPIEI